MSWRMPALKRSTEASLWGALFGVYVTALFIRHHLGSTSCELIASTSIYGEPEWTWFPPGTTCTYVVSDDIPAFTTGPGGWAYVLPAILICWGLALFRWRPHYEVMEAPAGAPRVTDADVERREMLETLAAAPAQIHDVVDLVMADEHPEAAVQEKLGSNRAGAEYVVSLLHWLGPRRQSGIREELAERWPAEGDGRSS